MKNNFYKLIRASIRNAIIVFYPGLSEIVCDEYANATSSQSL